MPASGNTKPLHPQTPQQLLIPALGLYTNISLNSEALEVGLGAGAYSSVINYLLLIDLGEGESSLQSCTLW